MDNKHNKLVEAVTNITCYEMEREDAFANPGPHIDKDLIREVVNTADDKLLEFTVRSYVSNYLNNHFAKEYNSSIKEKENESI